MLKYFTDGFHADWDEGSRHAPENASHCLDLHGNPPQRVIYKPP